MVSTDEGVGEGLQKKGRKRRKMEHHRLRQVRGCALPWEPYPGAKGGFELISKFRLPVERAEFAEIVKDKIEFTRRKSRIRKRTWRLSGTQQSAQGEGAEQ